MIGAYIRVSTAGQNLEMQRLAISQAAKARGDTIERWWGEKTSVSQARKPGQLATRVKLDEVRDAAMRGEIEKLYVYRLDRLTRRGIKDTLDVLSELRANGCSVITVADGWQPDGPGYELIAAILGWAAHMEALAMKERVAASHARLAAQGRKWGRPKGLTKAELEQAHRLKSEGLSSYAVAKALGKPRSTIYDALAGNGAYKRPNGQAKNKPEKKSK